MIALICAAIALLIVTGLGLIVFFGWGGAMMRLERYSLAGIAAGIAWAGVPRFLGRPPGLGDLLLLASLAAYFVARYGPELVRHLDRIDGRQDGRLGPFGR